MLFILIFYKGNSKDNNNLDNVSEDKLSNANSNILLILSKILNSFSPDKLIYFLLICIMNSTAN